MMKRRGFLGAIAGAPVAAKAAVETGVNEVMGGNVGAEVGFGAPAVVDVDPVEEAARAFLSGRADKARERLFHDFPIPISITSKKSWSDEFKRSVAMQMKREFDAEYPSLWKMSPQDLIRFAIKKGFQP